MKHLKITFLKLIPFIGIVVLLFLFPFAIQAEVKSIEQEQQAQRTVTGVVVDREGEPLIGITVRILGGGGAVTDINGRFQLEVTPEDQLQFSFIGMETQTILVGDQTVFNIEMVEDGFTLDEFVVTGFVRQRRQSIVSAIETIDPRELRIPASNLTTALAGRVAGIIGFQPSGEPGADNAQFFIRGVTTFGYASNPLILLDGFEVSADVLARIDPDAIASFSVLKDATAVALYGARGANGVIVVTTRRGEAGRPRISARIETRMSQPTQIQQTVDGVTFMRYFNQAQFNDNPILPPRYSAQRIQNTIDNLNPYAFPNIDWYDSMFRSHAMNQHVNFNVSGGGTMVRYFLSLSYNREEGILRNHSINNFRNNIVINRYNLLTNITMDLTETTTLDFNMNSIFEDRTGPLDSTHDVFRSVVWTNPVEFPKYFAPDAANINTTHTLFGRDPEMRMTNPFAQMVRGYRTGHTGRITSQFSLDQDLRFITEGFRARVRVSINNDNYFGASRMFNPYFYAIRTFDEFTNTYELQQIHRGSTALGNPTTHRSGRFRTYVEGGFTYNRRFDGRHDIAALLIYNQESIQNTGAYTLLTQILPRRSQAIRGRINYGFRDRYIVEASLTYTGSENFAREHRWGAFPAMGASYIISNEYFWEPLRDIVPMLRFRYSTGWVGNDLIASAANRFFFLSEVHLNAPGFTWGQNFNTHYGGFFVARYANPAITWELSRKQNMGFEIELFRHRQVRISMDRFSERRTHIYQGRDNIPASLGVTAAGVQRPAGNVGAVNSWGWDGSIELNHSISRDAWIQGRFNFTFAQNKIIENEEPMYAHWWSSRIGWPINTQRGFIAERLFIDAEDVRNAPHQELGSIVQPGDIKFRDINGDGRINSDDMVHMGFPTIPEISYGFGLSGGWRNWDLSFFMQGQARVSFFISPGHISPFYNYRGALDYIIADHWSPDNPVSHTFWPRLSTMQVANNNVTSTWWLRSAAFLRMRNVEFGYTLPSSIMDRTPLSNIRIYFSGQNLFQISDFDLWDPELRYNGFNYPLQRVFSLGAHLTF